MIKAHGDISPGLDSAELQATMLLPRPAALRLIENHPICADWRNKNCQTALASNSRKAKKCGSKNMDRKICCVGFHKTGTSSLRGALTRLGLSVGQVTKQINEVLDPSAPNAREVITDIAISHLTAKDAIQDSPSAFIYAEYDLAFPGSKFILTKRSTNSWIRSMSTYFQDQTSPLRRWMYGVDQISGNERLICDIYEQKNQEIRDYFRDRPGDFLEMDITSGDGWFELVGFLGRDMLPPFPHVNASSARRKQQ